MTNQWLHCWNNARVQLYSWKTKRLMKMRMYPQEYLKDPSWKLTWLAYILIINFYLHLQCYSGINIAYLTISKEHDSSFMAHRKHRTLLLIFSQLFHTLTISRGPGFSERFSIGNESAIVFSLVLVVWKINKGHSEQRSMKHNGL